MKIENKAQALQKLQELDEQILIRMAELSENKKARSYFTNPLLWSVLKNFLK